MKKPISLKRIVCVDDNAFILNVLQWYLKTRGYLALPCSTGVTALRMIAKHGADAVVLDYHMPELNGGELAAAIRARNPRIPIVMFSGETDVPVASLSLVDSFVQKAQPNAFSVVGDFLDSLLSRRRRRTLVRENAPNDGGSVVRNAPRAAVA